MNSSQEGSPRRPRNIIHDKIRAKAQSSTRVIARWGGTRNSWALVEWGEIDNLDGIASTRRSWAEVANKDGQGAASRVGISKLLQAPWSNQITAPHSTEIPRLLFAQPPGQEGHDREGYKTVCRHSPSKKRLAMMKEAMGKISRMSQLRLL